MVFGFKVKVNVLILPVGKKPGLFAQVRLIKENHLYSTFSEPSVV